jgi:2-oxoglutarate ferredoxin oxidoreductase subunit beta
MAGIGNTMVEILASCPTNWQMDSMQAIEWLEENLIPAFPLGVIKDTIDKIGGPK